MSSLSSKSAQEISEMLDDFGIKHGPVVDSTRRLYEKKLREAMAKGGGAKYSKPSPDKTYYREEEEEVTYVYRTPVKNAVGDYSDRGSYLSSRPDWAERDHEHETSYSTYQRSRPQSRGTDYVNEHYMHETPSTYRGSSLKSPPMKSGQDAPKPPQSTRLVPMWVQLVFFLAVAVFLYLVFSNMETNESLKSIE